MSLIFSSGTSSVLLNGVPGKVLHCRRGVRQGDPLSPLLFVLTADVLQSLLNHAKEDGLLQLPILCQHNQEFPILQYANDTLIFMEACDSQLSELKRLLQVFYVSTGLKVNYSKSTLVPINVDDQWTNALAQSFGCEVGSFPFTYLGLPLGVNKPKVIDCLPLVKKCEQRLSATSAFFCKQGD